MTAPTLVLTYVTIVYNLAAKLIRTEIEEEAEEGKYQRQDAEEYLSAAERWDEKFMTAFLLFGSLPEGHGVSPRLHRVGESLNLILGQFEGDFP